MNTLRMHAPSLVALVAGEALVRLQESQSLEARVQAVHNAIWARNDRGLNDEDRWYPVDVLEDAVILRRGQQIHRATYTVDADGGITFGEPERVEAEYTPVRVQESVADAVSGLVEAAAEEPQGIEWDVTIIRPGFSLNGLYYPPETLREAAALFEGVHVYVFDDSATGHRDNPAQKTQGQMAGWIDGVRFAEGTGLVGRLHFLQEGVAEGTRKKLVDAWGRGKRDLFGLSIDARGTTQPAVVEQKKTRLVESIRQVLSVDVVLKPAAGGGFQRLVASATANSTQEVDMRVKRLLRILEARRPDALAGIQKETVTFGELAEIATEEELRESLQPEAAPVPAAAGAGAGSQAVGGDVLQETRVLNSQIRLERRLQESKLPELVQRRVQKRLDGQVLTDEQIQAAIDEEREYAAQLNPARVQVPAIAGNGIQVGASKLDRLQAALDRAFGLEPQDSALKTIAPIGLRRLYNEITMGHDPSVNGILAESAQQEMLQEAFTSATLPNLLANTLHRRLLKDYREVNYGEQFIYTRRPGGVPDFRTQESVRVGYFGDLSTVDPEAADYAEIAAYGEEKASWAVGQRGNLVTITRKHIINDDLGHVSKVVGRLGRAARRTFAQFVWDFFINNGNIYDAAAWFSAGHNNLQAAALSVAELDAADLKLFNQTELSSGKKLGLTAHVLVVPGALKALAYQINQSMLVPGSANNDANTWHHRFGDNNERIVVNPLLADANDWGVFANQADGDIIEVGFLNDQEEPELFTADNPTVGQMFTADKLQYKIRHEYGGAVVDYRTGVKAAVV